ncbi:MAG: hypothetical protein VX252_14275 [Myxococcota bacterium]|nr:hypothetical protein [Myxococcota bacterium]
MALLFRIPFRFFWLLLIAGASASLVSLGVVKGLDAAGIESPRTTLDVLASWQRRAEQVRRGRAIAYLGDSTALSDKGYKHTIPGQIATRLSQSRGMPPVVSLADAGLGPVDYYLLASFLGETRPAAIVLSLNLASLSSIWLSRSSHPEFASQLGLDRWVEAFGLPLSVSGITADRLLLYPLLEAVGLSALWRAIDSYQVRVLAGWRALESYLDGTDGPLATNQFIVFASLLAEKEKEEVLRSQQQARYGKAIAGIDSADPSLQLLSAALQNWDRSGIPVLLVILPVNVELFESLGIDNREGLRETSQRLTELANASGARVLDLHGLLPAVSFADEHGHFAVGTEPDGAKKIAKYITPQLRSMLKGRR